MLDLFLLHTTAVSSAPLVTEDRKLEHYTFRAESSIDRDPHGLGREVYTRLVQRMVQNGTTAASVFGTISTEAKSVPLQCSL